MCSFFAHSFFGCSFCLIFLFSFLCIIIVHYYCLSILRTLFCSLNFLYAFLHSFFMYYIFEYFFCLIPLYVFILYLLLLYIFIFDLPTLALISLHSNPFFYSLLHFPWTRCSSQGATMSLTAPHFGEGLILPCTFGPLHFRHCASVTQGNKEITRSARLWLWLDLLTLNPPCPDKTSGAEST